MDTGAKSSALHVENVEELGHGMVGFDVVLDRKRRTTVHVETKIQRRGRVRSSNGHYTTRIFVKSDLVFAGMHRSVEFSLVDRTAMIHRVLLGRTALTEVLVDVTGRYRQKKRDKLKTKKKSKKTLGIAKSHHDTKPTKKKARPLPAADADSAPFPRHNPDVIWPN